MNPMMFFNAYTMVSGLVLAAETAIGYRKMCKFS